jgi:hypothetical protein
MEDEMDLVKSVVSVNGPCSIFDSIITLYRSQPRQLTVGCEEEKINHGDWGYIISNGEKKERLFLKTSRNKIEAFCLQHGKEPMGADVNKNASEYVICGNIFK